MRTKVDVVKLKKADIIITHIPPIKTKEIKRVNNEFYYFNGENIIKSLKPKLWIAGHIHDSFNKKIDNTNILINPLGYKNERKNFKILRVKI